MDAAQWLEGFARELEVEAPGEEEVERVLELAAEAAHSSERIAAPIACWLGARSGKSPAELVEIARRVGGS